MKFCRVKSNRQFVIPFKGLKTGKHGFVFNINDKFFDDFEGSEITKAKVYVNIDLIKVVNMIELEFRLKGSVIVTCDRCLDEFEMPVEYDTKLYVKFGDITEEQTDEVVILSYAEGELDITQYIYEYIHLSLPYKRVHPNDEKGRSTCNKDMLKRLNEYAISGHADTHLGDLKNLMNQN